MSNEVEIDFRHVLPYELRNVADSYETRADILESYTSSQYIQLTSSSQNTWSSQYVIRNSIPISNSLIEEVNFTASLKIIQNTETLSITPTAILTSGEKYSFSFLLPTPGIPQFSIANALASSFNVILGSGSLVSANVSDSIIPLSLFSLDRTEYLHDQTNLSSIENFARRPIVKGDPQFANKISSLKGPYVNSLTSTYDNNGNACDPYNNFSCSIDTNSSVPTNAGVTNVSHSVTSDFNNTKYTLFFTVGNADLPANTAVAFTYAKGLNLIYKYKLYSPLNLGFTAVNQLNSCVLTNISQLQINKIAVPNPQYNALIYQYDFSVANTLGSAYTSFSLLNINDPNAVASVGVSSTTTGNITAPVVEPQTHLLYYKTVNLPQKLIPKKQNLWVYDYGLYNTQLVYQPLSYDSTGVSFVSQSFILSTVPSHIYLWFGYQASQLTYTTPKIPIVQIMNVQNISLNGRSIMSGMVNNFLVANSTMKKVKRSLNDFGSQNFGSNNCGGIGNVLCISLEDMQLDGLCEGMACNMQFQVNMSIRLLDERYLSNNADPFKALPSNTLSFFILAPYKKLCTLENNNLSITSSYVNSEIYNSVISENTTYANTNLVQFGGSWLGDAWDSIKSGIQSGIDQVKDAAKWAWDHKSDIAEAAKYVAPMVGLGEEEREFLPRDKNGNPTMTAGRVMTREQMRKKLHNK